MSRAGFTGRIVPRSGTGMVAAQFASATTEMGTGFATSYIYEPNHFGRARQAEQLIVITSTATGTRYGVQIRPVFDPKDESITDHLTMGTIVEVDGRRLQPHTVQPVWLENRPGGVYVRPNR